MVWLAKWIREHQNDARVLLITDRTELDEQIEGVFSGVNETIYRTKSGADLLGTLNQSAAVADLLADPQVPRLRGRRRPATRPTPTSSRELNAKLPKDFAAKGNLFVFVDEAHRTQSGKMHDAMKELLPGAMFIGFTGTPLLKADKATSIETFGSFIHTYKFDEAVDDGVVLDLRYEARNIDQDLIARRQGRPVVRGQDQGHDRSVQGRAEEALGHDAEGRLAPSRAPSQIVDDILLDMETKPRLMDGRGNAMLVGASIYQACKFYELFCQAGFKGKCAIVTILRAAGRRHLQGRLRRGRHREAAPVRHLPPDAGRPLQRACRQGHGQGRAVREGGQGAASSTSPARCGC